MSGGGGSAQSAARSSAVSAGGALLLAYTLGYVTPLLLAASGAGALKRVLSMREWSGWVTPLSGCMLLTGGTYGLLSRLPF